MPCEAERRSRAAYGKIVWSWRPQAGVKSPRWCVWPDRVAHISDLARRRGQECIAPRGERDISRQTTAQGRPVIGLHLCLPCERLPTHHCTGALGCQPVPGLPCALPMSKGVRAKQNPGAGAPRDRDSMWGCLTVEIVGRVQVEFARPIAARSMVIRHPEVAAPSAALEGRQPGWQLGRSSFEARRRGEHLRMTALA